MTIFYNPRAELVDKAAQTGWWSTSPAGFSKTCHVVPSTELTQAGPLNHPDMWIVGVLIMWRSRDLNSSSRDGLV